MSESSSDVICVLFTEFGLEKFLA
uniref:Uncharacterized protein n=1 Tax=Arundo donax TaxID=35708 RepID=A0A0A8Z927_ARUDO